MQSPTVECFQEHSSSFFSPLLLLLHKETQDYLNHLLHRLQVHDCALHKKGKKCGFFKDPIGKMYLENKHTNTKTRMHVHTTRGYLYLNNYNQTITINWAANTDIQFCGNLFGAAQYCAYYASKSKLFSEFANSFIAATSHLDLEASLA
jgi:hypothetical protein